MKNICKNCKFWVCCNPELGFCKRYPPLAIKERLNMVIPNALWATTDQNDWCGEFKAKTADISLPVDEFTANVSRFMRVRKKGGKPIETIEQFLALSKAEILSTKCAGEVTYYDILDIQKKLKGIKANWREEKADSAAREALGIV